MLYKTQAQIRNHNTEKVRKGKKHFETARKPLQGWALRSMACEGLPGNSPTDPLIDKHIEMLVNLRLCQTNAIQTAQVVKQLQDLDMPPAGALLVFDIPSTYFSDLEHVCGFLYSYPVVCTTCLPEDDCPPGSAEVYYRLKVGQATVEVTNGLR